MIGSSCCGALLIFIPDRIVCSKQAVLVDYIPIMCHDYLCPLFQEAVVFIFSASRMHIAIFARRRLKTSLVVCTMAEYVAQTSCTLLHQQPLDVCTGASGRRSVVRSKTSACGQDFWSQAFSQFPAWLTSVCETKVAHFDTLLVAISLGPSNVNVGICDIWVRSGCEKK